MEAESTGRPEVPIATFVITVLWEAYICYACSKGRISHLLQGRGVREVVHIDVDA